MRVVCRPGRLKGLIDAIPSKSHAHRAMIASAFSDGPTRLVMRDRAGEDVLATQRCLEALGASFSREDGAFVVTPAQGPPEDPLLDCGESGSTLRFLLPVAAALGRGGRFVGAGRLPERPIGPLVASLRQGGVTADRDSLPLALKGRLRSGEYSLPGNVSSQFVSGMLLALPLLPGGGSVRLLGPLESSGYVDMTLETLRDFSVPAAAAAGDFLVPPGEGYRSPGEVTIEGDWSNMAFFLAGGALGGEVRCLGLSPSSAQKDKAVAGLLRRFGSSVRWEGGALGVTGGPLEGAGAIDAREIPDLIPVLAVTASFARGKTLFEGAARLRLKESDRLESTASMIRALGGDAREGSDRLEVTGGAPLEGGVVDCRGDHRIAMAGAVAALGCRNETVLLGAEAVNKSYPSFFQDYRSLGGDCDVIDDR